ncbi:MAG: hypothetical protein K2J04_03880, partial [Lachnospiraceae bacterium]|nr:hypothetical protein [Lachnospiraceae bacterium]
MKVKSAYTILCLCMVLGMFTGCGVKEKEAEAEVMPDAKNNTGLEMADETADEETPEGDSETLNAAGMPLMDNTALLASVTTPGGKVVEQYEYDKDGHMLRHFDRKYSHIYEYEYDSAGNLSRVSDWHYGVD